MIASRGLAPFLLARIIIAQVCVSVNLYFIELNSKIIIYGVSDLNNPPSVPFLQTGTNPDGLPSDLGGNGCFVIQHNGGNELYSAQLAFSFGGDKIAIRRRYTTSEWTNWKYFIAT